MSRTKSSIYRFILDFLAEDRPIVSKDLNDVLDDQNAYKAFLKALKKSRDGEKVVSFNCDKQRYTIELVKDFEQSL